MLEPAVDSLGLAKFSRPVLKRALPRERLFKQLDTGCEEGAALWISGPGGVGKTTLVSSFLESRDRPYLWFRIDEADADAATFFYYLGLAASRVVAHKGKQLPVLTPEYLPGLPIFARQYFRELYGCFEVPFTIAFDNVQLASEAGPLPDILRIAIEEVPATGSVLLVSRDEPGQEFARLLAGPAMNTIGSAALRFTLDESVEMLQELGAENMPDATLKQIHEKAQGWASGLVLLQEQVRANRDQPLDGVRIEPQVTFDFFAGEVFRNTEQDEQEFLLQTAFLPEMSARMAEQLTGNKESSRILTDLTRRNFFTEKLQLAQPMYRYHSLFQEFLLARAHDAYSPERIARIRCDAAGILVEEGRIEVACELLKDAGEWEELGQLVLSHAQGWIAQGRYSSVAGWISALPAGHVASNPYLLFWQGVSDLPYDQAAARGRLESALELFEQQGDRTGALNVWPLIVESFLLEWGDCRPLDRWIDWLDQTTRDGQDISDSAIEASVSLGMVSAIWMRKPHHARAEEWADRCEHALSRLTDENEKVAHAAKLAQYFTTTGEFQKGLRILNSVGKLVDPDRISPLSVLLWYTSRSIYAWLTAEEGACQPIIDHALNFADETGVHVLDFLILAQGTYGALSEGDADRARVLLKKMELLLGSARVLDGTNFHLLTGWEQTLSGNLAAAMDSLDAGLRMAEQAGMFLGRTLCTLGRVIARYDAGLEAEAVDDLRHAWDLTWATRNNHLACACLFLNAYILFRQGDAPKGREALANALRIARENGFVNFPFWRQDIMAELCAHALTEGIEVEFVQGLIRKRRLKPTRAAKTNSLWPWPIKVHTFGAFRLILDGEELRFDRRPPRKPLELLRVLIALGGEGVPEAAITDSLWPDKEGDQAHQSFVVTLHRLRELLQSQEAITITDGAASLNRQYFWVDTWVFNAHLAEAETVGRDGQQDRYRQALKRALAVYKGTFMPADCDHPWSIPVREEYRRKFIQAACLLGDALIADQEYAAVLSLYQSALAVEPLSEELYFRTIHLYEHLGRTNDALELFDLCTQTFEAELGQQPSARIANMVRKLEA